MNTRYYVDVRISLWMKEKGRGERRKEEGQTWKEGRSVERR